MELSKIRRSDIFFMSTYQDLEKIVFTENIKGVNEKCDVGIVLGGISMIPYRVEEVINLYNNGLIDRILLSGGIGFLNLDRKNSEASKMYNYLLHNGVPEYCIIMESQSRNTIENIKNSIELLATDYDLSSAKLVLITSDFHIKRSFEITARYVCRSNLFGSGVKDGVTDIDSWQNTLFGKKIILQEALLLRNYAKNNFIADLNIDGVSFSRIKKLR